ncbi:unnamed protein product [Gongylonema pulchrum]|uniref:Uncharacterized protein n=1 Tax=Gongylonema pulchrum TaxID=637853 RepID=A0A183E880_9BILA|nr:unnamed protein product [Gongylonema pulchrum]
MERIDFSRKRMYKQDTGKRRPIIREQSINRPESVLQLARKFAEASAAQDKRIHISNRKLAVNGGQNLTIATTATSCSGPTSPVGTGGDNLVISTTINKKPGGIACLCFACIIYYFKACRRFAKLPQHLQFQD